MRKFILLSGFIFLAFSSIAQIKGNVKDNDGKKVANASVSLQNAKDSAVVKIAVTDANGLYEFKNIKEGRYFTTIAFIGYAPARSNVFEVSGSGDVNVTSITITKLSGNLKDVTVTAKKPVVEVKADKTILNVENSINAVGNDALELLRKSPGVLVDKDDNISLSGKNGVKVYVDGKPSPLSGQDLSYYLKSLQSSQIEAIEIITNPSAKYEAEGNAGIINIRLKKNKSFGTNGSVNAGYNIGVFPKYNGGFSLNHRNKNVNLFGNFNYNRAHNENFMNLYRDVQDTIFDQHTRMQMRNKSFGFKAGMDYFLNNRNTVGVMVNGNLANINFSNHSQTAIAYKPTGVVDRYLIADNTNKMKRNNINANLNYRFADTSGHELNVDADYAYYDLNGDQYQPNIYWDPTFAHTIGQNIYNMIAPSRIDIYSLKADYEQNFKKGRLGFGGKISYVNSDNDFSRFNIYPTEKFMDRNNFFGYDENINALYVNYNRQLKGVMIQFGVRAENTNVKGHSSGTSWNGSNYAPFDSTFKRNYTDFFPSAAVTFNKNPKNQWGLSYSRRIDRPAYQDLNPFEFKLDEYTYQKGNTLLTPQYTNSVSLTNTFNFKFTTKLTYSHVNDVFSQLVDTIDVTKSFLTKKNLATQDIVSLNFSMPLQIKWYSVFANINAYYSHYKADLGGEGRTIDLDVWAANLYIQQTAKIAKTTTLEVSTFYTSPSIWQGTFKSKEMWGIDFGVQQTLFKGKVNAKATVTDIFQTMRWGGTSNFAGQYLKVNGGWESRQFRVSLMYRFGNNQVKAARQRKSGAEEESQRVGGQGGGLNN